MSTENWVNLELDQHRRIGIKDVISMLKGLRREAVFKIVQVSEVPENAREPDINNESINKAQHNASIQDTFKKSLSVKGFFGDGTKLFDTYSQTQVTVENGSVNLDNPYDTALLELAH